MTTGNETETWHDSRPSHGTPPAYVQAECEAAAAAWRMYDAACEEYISAKSEGLKAVILDKMRRTEGDALSASWHASEAYKRWQRELAAARQAEQDANIAAQVAAEYGEQDYSGTAQDAEMFSIQ